MTDIELAKANLAGHTISLCKNGNRIYSDKRGIKPMMDFIENGVDLNGYSVADIVVGKAAALLFIKCKVKEVYAKILSEKAKNVFVSYGIPYSYGTLTEYIINRTGTDMCPMESTVLSTDDPEEAYLLLKDKLKSMQEK